ncbi:hypothetical protein T492DRAFT_894398 [Pavlovales sp. CCMP2436]|nr:hypothetical protein T492DRAFT_894398 [Pavlovales sp. CCMP2436]
MAQVRVRAARGNASQRHRRRDVHACRSPIWQWLRVRHAGSCARAMRTVRALKRFLHTSHAYDISPARGQLRGCDAYREVFLRGECLAAALLGADEPPAVVGVVQAQARGPPPAACARGARLCARALDGPAPPCTDFECAHVPPSEFVSESECAMLRMLRATGSGVLGAPVLVLAQTREPTSAMPRRDTPPPGQARA